MGNVIETVRVPITELPTFVEKKSKQTDLNDTSQPMSLPINDLSYLILYAPTDFEACTCTRRSKFLTHALRDSVI